MLSVFPEQPTEAYVAHHIPVLKLLASLNNISTSVYKGNMLVKIHIRRPGVDIPMAGLSVWTMIFLSSLLQPKMTTKLGLSIQNPVTMTYIAWFKGEGQGSCMVSIKIEYVENEELEFIVSGRGMVIHQDKKQRDRLRAR